MKQATKDLTSGNITRNLLLFSFPLVLSSLLSQAFGLVDMLVAGRFKAGLCSDYGHCTDINHYCYGSIRESNPGCYPYGEKTSEKEKRCRQ